MLELLAPPPLSAAWPQVSDRPDQSLPTKFTTGDQLRISTSFEYRYPLFYRFGVGIVIIFGISVQKDGLIAINSLKIREDSSGLIRTY